MERIRQRSKLIRPLALPIIIFMCALLASNTWIDEVENVWLKGAIAALPLLAGALITWMLMRMIKKLDELEQRIILEAGAFSGFLTIFILLALSLLYHNDVPPFHLNIIALVSAVFIMVFKLYGNWKYK